MALPPSRVGGAIAAREARGDRVHLAGHAAVGGVADRQLKARDVEIDGLAADRFAQLVAGQTGLPGDSGCGLEDEPSG
jgi:hypothetical protein